MRSLRNGLLLSAVSVLALSASGCIIPSHIVEHDRFQGIVLDSATGEGVEGVTVRTARIKDNVEQEINAETTNGYGGFTSDIDYDYGVVWVFWLLTIPPSTPDPTDVVLHLSKEGYEPMSIQWDDGKWWPVDRISEGKYTHGGTHALGDGGRDRTTIYDFDHGRIPVHDVFLYGLPIIRMQKAE